MERRNFLRAAVAGVGSSVALGFTLPSQALAHPAQTGPSPYGDLLSADSNGIQLPSGFTSRIIARSTQTVSGTGYTWHSAPDGGECFADGTGWIYVSNAELGSGAGGVSAVKFNSKFRRALSQFKSHFCGYRKCAILGSSPIWEMGQSPFSLRESGYDGSCC